MENQVGLKPIGASTSVLSPLTLQPKSTSQATSSAIGGKGHEYKLESNTKNLTDLFENQMASQTLDRTSDARPLSGPLPQVLAEKHQQVTLIGQQAILQDSENVSSNQEVEIVQKEPESAKDERQVKRVMDEIRKTEAGFHKISSKILQNHKELKETGNLQGKSFANDKLLDDLISGQEIFQGHIDDFDAQLNSHLNSLKDPSNPENASQDVDLAELASNLSQLYSSSTFNAYTQDLGKLALIQDALGKNEGFYNQAAKSNPTFNPQTDTLVQYVQRLPRHVLLLSELKKNIDKLAVSSKDEKYIKASEDLNAAIENVKKHTQIVNENIRNGSYKLEYQLTTSPKEVLSTLRQETKDLAVLMKNAKKDSSLEPKLNQAKEALLGKLRMLDQIRSLSPNEAQKQNASPFRLDARSRLINSSFLSAIHEASRLVFADQKTDLKKALNDLNEIKSAHNAYKGKNFFSIGENAKKMKEYRQRLAEISSFFKTDPLAYERAKNSHELKDLLKQADFFYFNTANFTEAINYKGFSKIPPETWQKKIESRIKKQMEVISTLTPQLEKIDKTLSKDLANDQTRLDKARIQKQIENEKNELRKTLIDLQNSSNPLVLEGLSHPNLEKRIDNAWLLLKS